MVGALFSYRGQLIEPDITQAPVQAEPHQWGHLLGQPRWTRYFAAISPPRCWWEIPEQDIANAVTTLNERRKQMGAEDPIREVRTLRFRDARGRNGQGPLPQGISERSLTPNHIAFFAAGDCGSWPRRCSVLRMSRGIPALSDLPRSRSPLLDRAGRNAPGESPWFTRAGVGILTSKDIEGVDLPHPRLHSRSGGRRSHAPWEGLLLWGHLLGHHPRWTPKATAVAFVLVTILVLLAVGRFRPTMTTLVRAVALGVAWLVGLAAAAARVRVNFLNFVVLPITFGISVDYAVNIVMRYQREGRGSSGTGDSRDGERRGAVLLTTTVIGYASLLVADNLALSGLVCSAALGEICCLSAALIDAPRLDAQVER